MIRRAEEIRVREVAGAQGGKGKVIFHDWLIPAEDCPGHGRVISQVEIPAGSSIGWHQHVGEFEAYIVLAGQALVNDNGTELTLNPGDMHLCKDGNFHSVEAVGEASLILQAVILNTLG